MTETPAMSVYEKTFAKSDKTDAILVVQGKKIHVNKAVLSYHSDYFKTLFNSKSDEEIHLEDVEYYDRFAVVLSLVHKTPIKIDFEPTILLDIAEQFQLPAAKRHLERFLITKDGNEDNLIETADKYKLSDLLDMKLKEYCHENAFYNNFRKNYGPRHQFFDNLSDETNVKLFHRLLELTDNITISPSKPESDDIYLEVFAKTDKTDAILVVQGKKLHVNKALLSYHSDFFESLFHSDFKEKSMEEIPIKDVDFKDFAVLLSLVQTEPIMPTEKNVEKVLELSEQFLMPSVQRILELFLISTEMGKLEKMRIGEKYGMDNLVQNGVNGFSEFKNLPDNNAYKDLSARTKKKLFYEYLKY